MPDLPLLVLHQFSPRPSQKQYSTFRIVNISTKSNCLWRKTVKTLSKYVEQTPRGPGTWRGLPVPPCPLRDRSPRPAPPAVSSTNAPVCWGAGKGHIKAYVNVQPGRHGIHPRVLCKVRRWSQEPSVAQPSCEGHTPSWLPAWFQVSSGGERKQIHSSSRVSSCCLTIF